MNKTKDSVKMCWLMLVTILLLFPNTNFSQPPNTTLKLGILESFEGFTGAGAVSVASGVNWNGDAGTNFGIISGLVAPPNFNGNIYNANAVSEQCRLELLRLYIQLNDLFVDYPSTHLPAFGGGETISPGVYFTPGEGSIGGPLTLDGGGNPNAFFVIKFNGALTVGAGAEVNLTGGVQSCNVFFIADGAILLAATSKVKGTLFSKVGAVGLGASSVLEGRIFTFQGSINAASGAILTRPPGTTTIPVFCETKCIPAPEVDVLGVLSEYALYTKTGIVGNTSTSGIDGNIGTNVGSNVGFGSSIVTGEFHTADASTAEAKIALDNAYNLLMAIPNTVPSDPGVLPFVLLPHSSTFGTIAAGGETIYPGVYYISTGGIVNGTLILDAQNNPNAIFVFKIAGALNFAAQTKMILANGASRCNIFWIGGASPDGGALNIGASSILKGTFIANLGACNSGAGVFLAGRQLSTGAAVNSDVGIIYNNPTCITSITLNPNPLPINLLTFTGECLPNQIRLNWETASESNNDYFSIERSQDGTNWSEIGKMNGAGNSSSSRKYFLNDENQMNEVSYYQLKQHDFSGVTRSYSPISVQNCFSGNEALSIYPNPAKNAININFNGDVEHVINTSIIDLFGRKTYQSSIYQSAINTEDFEDGIYFLHLILKSGSITRKFLIAK
jgi:hypothetical protein